MCVCRTCLAKGDLQPIFSDKNLVNIRTKQLFTVTGIKIAINDGLPQQICTQCSNLIMGALKLREISTKSNEILQKKLQCNTKYKDSQISKEKDDIAISDTRQTNIKEISKRKDMKIKSEKRKIAVGNSDSVTKYKDSEISKEKDDIAISDTRQTNIKEISKRKDMKIRSEKRKIAVDNSDSVTKYKDSEISKEKDDIAISDTRQTNIKEISKRKDMKIRSEKRKIAVDNSDSVTKYKDSQISKEKDDIAISDTRQTNIKEISKRKDMKIQSEKRKIAVGNSDSVMIEDFESSDESQSFNQIYLEYLNSDVDEPKICIEDFMSSDSFDGEDIGAVVEILQEHSRNDHGYKVMRDKQLLERERRKTETQKLDHKLLSLAVSPYDPGGPIRCSLCSTVVKSVPNFKNHAKIHYELKNACEECGKKFLTPSLVRYHQQRVHGRPKRLACTQCTYTAVDSQQLQNHERATHTGERPFSCDVCGDSFRMRRNIVQHMRKHFGVRNLQCERCPARFRSRSELSGHQSKVHDHVFSYPCYLCRNTYKRPASVKKHLLNAHGLPPHQQLTVKCVKMQRRSCDKSD